VNGTSDYGIMYSHCEDSALYGYCDAEHSKTKHIDICHHFIRDLVENKIVTLEHVGTKEQVADMFTKALDAIQFEKLRGQVRDLPL
jgi:hypothetical protein